MYGREDRCDCLCGVFRHYFWWLVLDAWCYYPLGARILSVLLDTAIEVDRFESTVCLLLLCLSYGDLFGGPLSILIVRWASYLSACHLSHVLPRVSFTLGL